MNNTFGPLSAKPHIPDPYTHRAEIPKDDGGPITFKWHVQRGILRNRMSGLELAQFVIEHMPHVLQFFIGYPRIYTEFRAIYWMLATTIVEVPLIATELGSSLVLHSTFMDPKVPPPRRAKIRLNDPIELPWLKTNDNVQLVKDAVGMPVLILVGGKAVATLEQDKESEEWEKHQQELKQATDKILPWIRAITRTEADDIIHLSLFDKTTQPDGPKFFVMGGA